MVFDKTRCKARHPEPVNGSPHPYFSIGRSDAWLNGYSRHLLPSLAELPVLVAGFRDGRPRFKVLRRVGKPTRLAQGSGCIKGPVHFHHALAHHRAAWQLRGGPDKGYIVPLLYEIGHHTRLIDFDVQVGIRLEDPGKCRGQMQPSALVRRAHPKRSPDFRSCGLRVGCDVPQRRKQRRRSRVECLAGFGDAHAISASPANSATRAMALGAVMSSASTCASTP